MKHDVFYTYIPIPFVFAKTRIDRISFGGIVRESCLSRFEHIWQVGLWQVGRTNCIKTWQTSTNMPSCSPVWVWVRQRKSNESDHSDIHTKKKKQLWISRYFASCMYTRYTNTEGKKYSQTAKQVLALHVCFTFSIRSNPWSPMGPKFWPRSRPSKAWFLGVLGHLFLENR